MRIKKQTLVKLLDKFLKTFNDGYRYKVISDDIIYYNDNGSVVYSIDEILEELL